MEINVHGLTLMEAKQVIQKAVQEAIRKNDSSLLINHGFNHGNKIKTMVLNDHSISHPLIIRRRSHLLNPGVTIFDLKVEFD